MSRSGGERIQIQRGDIYYCDLQSKQYQGSIQQGIRPVVILQNDKGNKHSPTTIVAPITSQNKPHLPTHAYIQTHDILEATSDFSNSIVLFEQITTVNMLDLKNKIGAINLESEAIKRALEISIGL